MATLPDLMVFLTLLCSFLLKASSQGHEGDKKFTPIYNQNNFIRQQKGKDIKKYMNFSKDPCENFYEFACGNWVTFHHSPKDLKDNTTPLMILQKKVRQDLHKILIEEVTLEDRTIHRKVKEFHKSCMTAEKNGLMQKAFLKEFIANNRGFPAAPESNWILNHANYYWQEVVASLYHNYDIDILIGLQIELNYLNNYENSIYLTEPSTLIPEALCNMEATQQIDIREKQYEEIERKVSENLKQWLSLKTDEARKIAADIVTFEFDLCCGMRAKGMTISPNYTRKTLNEFTHQFNDSIDFKAFVTESLGIVYNKPVFMAAPQYYQQLLKTIQENNSTTVANYIMYRALSHITIPLEDTPSRRPDYCLNLVKTYFPKILGFMYLRKYGSNEMTDEMRALFEEIKMAFQELLKSNWVEQGVTRVSLSKLQEIDIYFPYYEKTPMHNISIDKEHFWRNLEQVMSLMKPLRLSRAFETNIPKPKQAIEAYDLIFKYIQTTRRVDVGMALLQEPFYRNSYPNSFVYATLGQMMAQAIATAFDDLHWDILASNSVNWDGPFTEEYQQTSECHRQQLSNYIYNEPNEFQNLSTVRDLMSVSSGLNVAFTAYLNWLESLNPHNNYTLLNDETLPDLDFTNTQLFFISYAQMFCRSEKHLHPKVMVSPLVNRKWEDFMVNGPLMNFNEFSREFGCLMGSQMNPADKCKPL